jgi:hypothetical protein
MAAVTLQVVESNTTLQVNNSVVDVNVSETSTSLSLGNSGPQGIKGDTGSTGPQGPQGIQGIQGAKGDKGDTGATGPQGATGATGATGPQGIQGIQGVTGETGAQGPAGDSSTHYHYNTRTNTTSGDPTTNQLGWNNATQISSTVLRVNHIDADSQDDSIFLHLINQYDNLIIQDKNNAANFQTWEVSGTPTLNATWDEFPVTLVNSSGTGTTNFANNHAVLLIIVSVGNVGPQGPTGPTGPQGATGPTGATGATGSSGVIAVTSPITNSGTSTSATIGINQAGLTIAQSQVTNLVTDLGLKANTATLSSSRDDYITADSVDMSTLPRNISSTSLIFASGTTNFTFFTPVQGGPVSQISIASGSRASAGLTLCRIGLYTYDFNTDECTLVARTASDTTLFNTINTLYTRSFNTTGGYPASYTLVAGQRYALGVIQVGTTTAFLLGASHSSLMTGFDLRIAATSSNADLPTTASSLSSTNARLVYGRFTTA